MSSESRLLEAEQLIQDSSRVHEIAIVYALQAMAAEVQQDCRSAIQLTGASLQLSLEYRDVRVFLGLRSLNQTLLYSGRAEDAVALFTCMARLPANNELPLSFRERLDSVKSQLSEDAINEAATCYREMDVWDVVALWIAELAIMEQAYTD